MSIELLKAAESLVADSIVAGILKERERIIGRIEDQICFDAKADADHKCSNHGGKCYELRRLIDDLVKGACR